MNAVSKFIVILLIGVSPFAWAKEGGSDTGGGNACFAQNGEGTLLELIGTTQPRQRGDRLKPTRLMKEAGLDIGGDIYKSRSLKMAYDHLERLAKKSPKTSVLLKEALLHLALMETPFVPETALQDGTSNIQCDGKIIAVAIYKVAGLLIVSDPLFNALDLQSQTALFIHEALRQVQISANGNGSDRELEDLTRKIMSDDSVSLDGDSFFSGVQRSEEGNVQVDASRFDVEHNYATMEIATFVRYIAYAHKGLRLSKAELERCRLHIERLVKYPTLTYREALHLPNQGLSSKAKPINQ